MRGERFELLIQIICQHLDCQYIDNRYSTSIYRTGLARVPPGGQSNPCWRHYLGVFFTKAHIQVFSFFYKYAKFSFFIKRGCFL